MFCTKCGKQGKDGDNFCGSCGNSLNIDLGAAEKVSESQIGFIESTKNVEEILSQANSITDEYKSKKSLHKPLGSFLNTGFAKERISEALNQKAIARFQGDAKHSSILPREICFAENSVLFIVENSMLARGTATALRRSEIEYIEVSRFESNIQLGMAHSSSQYWKLTFVTKWAGIGAGIPKGMMMAVSDPTWNFHEGEVSFYLPLGKTAHQKEEYEEMYSEKLDNVAAFYPIRISETIYRLNRSIGLMIGTGFWREIGN